MAEDKYPFLDPDFSTDEISSVGVAKALSKVWEMPRWLANTPDQDALELSSDGVESPGFMSRISRGSFDFAPGLPTIGLGGNKGLTDNQTEKIRAVFAEFDTDGSGKVGCPALLMQQLNAELMA